MTKYLNGREFSCSSVIVWIVSIFSSFFLAIVMSVLRITDYDYLIGIFKYELINQIWATNKQLLIKISMILSIKSEEYRRLVKKN